MKRQSDGGGQRLLEMALAIVTAAAVLALASDSRAAGSSPAANSVDPAIVGTWELAVPNAQGTARWVWEILPNGTYKFHAEGPGAPPSHSGSFSASGGRYTLKSTTTDWTDSGTYQLSSPTMLEAQGKLGAALWQRVQTASAEIIPSKVDWPVNGVPLMAERALAYVRAKWLPDAFLTTIDIEPTAGLGNAQSPLGEISIKFLFYSPGTQSLLSLTPNAAAGDIFPAGNADPNDELPLPTNFLDLPDAVADMRSHVRGNGIAQAHLENFASGSAFFGPAWMIDSNLSAGMSSPNCPTATRSEWLPRAKSTAMRT